MKTRKIWIISVFVSALVAGAMLTWMTPQATEGAKPPPPPTPTKYDTPIITCVGATQATIFLKVCAGPSGAPAGFTVQWVKHSDFPALTCDGSNQSPKSPKDDPNWPGDPYVCRGSFSGTPDCSIYNLAPNACVTLEIGNLNDAECGVGLTNCGANELDCGFEYVFRAFAHNAPGGLNRSDFTANLCCSTRPCAEFCVRTQGYWKTHPCDWPKPFVPGANGTALPDQPALTSNPNQQCACDAVNTILIGSLGYNQCDLLAALASSTASLWYWRFPVVEAYRRGG